MKYEIVFFSFLIFLSNCCEVRMPDSSVYDLTSLSQMKEIKKEFKHYNYRAGFCKPTGSPCKGNANSFASVFIPSQNSEICYANLSNSWGNGSKYIDPINKNLGISFSLGSGEMCTYSASENTYQVEYQLHCDSTKEFEFTNVMRVNGCRYQFIFLTKYGCPSAVSKGFLDSLFFGISASTLLLFLTMISLAYLMLFSYFNYRRNPKDGLVKALPHRQFWQKFFGYAMLGVKVTVQKIKRKIKEMQKK